MAAKTYNAPWGRRIWLITAGVVFLGFVVALVLPLTLTIDNPNDRWVGWLAPAVVFAIIGGTSLWTIRGFELSDDAIIVRRSFWRNRIPFARIESAEADARACERAWKTAGNDGLFAMHGRFRSKRLGKFQAYVTNPANAIVLRVPGDIIVISPGEPASFLRELNRRLERNRRST